jgi:hypothetical protein
MGCFTCREKRIRSAGGSSQFLKKHSLRYVLLPLNLQPATHIYVHGRGVIEDSKLRSSSRTNGNDERCTLFIVRRRVKDVK